jgi:hypothetical protein
MSHEIVEERISKAQKYLRSTSQFTPDEKTLYPDITAIGGNAKDLIHTIKISGCINVDDLPQLCKILKGVDE